MVASLSRLKGLLPRPQIRWSMRGLYLLRRQCRKWKKKTVSYPTNIYHPLVELILHNRDSYWDVLEDSRDRFPHRWIGVAPLNPEQEDHVVRQDMDHILTLWNTLSESKGSMVLSIAYARYITLETNELEGVFQLTGEVYTKSIIVFIGLTLTCF